ncbi:plastocyanin/azurin family copper-binding protein [Marinobacter sp. R17]|uniref:cupredoxin domain-containing protein n=1 Tax=Marinobacter sp. R17 TaxID=2484250 RepID=UPI001CC1CD2F|nr:plastocyanin/azurin family copper-binding protein [Marinobacter sp. R17]
MKSKQRVRALTLVMAVGFYGAASAASAAGNEHGGHHNAGAGGVGHEGMADNLSRTVDIVLHDNYFEPEQITVEPGETLRFRLRNDGALVHQFSLGTPDMHDAQQDRMQMMVEHGIIAGGVLNREQASMDMGNGHTMKTRTSGSLLLAPGETSEMVWQFADQAMIEFACNVPGHYQAGMVGEIDFQ